MRIEETVDVEASQQRAWETLIDIEAWALRIGTVERADVVSAGALSVGSRVRLKQSKLGESLWEVVTWDPPNFFAMRQKSSGLTSLVGHRIEPVNDHSARLVLTFDLSGVAAPIIGRLSRRMTAQHLRREAQDLKRAIESPAV